MKANAPNKIYTDENGNNPLSKRHCDSDIEYSRTDAFIEKAEKYLKNQFIKDVSVLAGDVVSINFSAAINNFINYIKGK